MNPLDVFSPETRAWFEAAFAEPTPAQALGWPAIARGGHTLIQAPTGSGKTLAAFLYGIDQLNPEPGQGLRLVYVSPLKALNYDILGNSLPHLHTHVIPRYADDPKPGWPFPFPEEAGQTDESAFRRDLEALRG